MLPSNRVSIVSVGLACLTSCADLVPSLISSLSHYLPFTSHSDPKLKSRTAMVSVATPLTNIIICCIVTSSYCKSCVERE